VIITRCVRKPDLAWRTVVISNPARLRVENDQLVIIQQDSISLPIEDIAVLMLESPEVLLSSALLDRLAQHEVTLLACDKRHLPSMACMPFAGHSRLAGVQRMQLSASVPFQKRCWQAIIRYKIANQAMCLKILNRPNAQSVASMVEKVTSGDASNVESVAAREHFRAAFGVDFTRGAEDSINSALNYGYAVLRAAVARALTFHGFLPAHGIHHRSELNQFNLADDFIEPLRPVVDLHVASVHLEGELTKVQRENLIALIHADVLINGKRQAILHAVEIMAGSFLAACREKDPRLLKLPELLPLKLHAHE
jgi:CRISP-associated protein Cas1